jgi:tyrosyl-tRNA synthetase
MQTENLTKDNFGGVDIADMLVAAGFVKTKSEGRRAVEAGGIKIGNTKITDPFARVAVVANEVFILENVGQGDWS